MLPLCLHSLLFRDIKPAALSIAELASGGRFNEHEKGHRRNRTPSGINRKLIAYGNAAEYKQEGAQVRA
jgi:hypothetical protein